MHFRFQTAVSIRGNSIYSNGGLGIDVGPAGVTRSSPWQNFPDLTAAVAGNSTSVEASLNSAPNATFILDFYANATADPSGYGEGERWIGSALIETDSSGNWSGVVTVGASTASEVITATATDILGSTSEFSKTIEVVPPVREVAVDIVPESINVDSNGTLTVIVFSEIDFDATQIDVTSVRFAGASAWESTLVDRNGDGRLDLQLKFRRQDTVLEQIYSQLLQDDHDADGVLDSTGQTAQVAVTGQTIDDLLFSGSDSVTLFLAGRSLRELLDNLFG